MSVPVKNRLVAVLLRILLECHWMMMSAAERIGPGKRDAGEDGCDILLTGTFHSANWILSHLKPLALSRGIRRIRVVTSCPIPPLDKVEVVAPVQWLARLIGVVPARLFTFIYEAVRSRPHAVGGFHLLLNGLTAALTARICGARSIYFCVGGPAEVQGGGILSENRLFEKLRAPDRRIESLLIRAAGRFDLIITMGKGAKEFFRKEGVNAEIHVVSGGIDAVRFPCGGDPPLWDVLFIGRLAPVKRIDLLLRALKIVKGRISGVKALIVGDGQLRGELETLSGTLSLRDSVEFAGYRDDVSAALGRSRIFVLTSKTEGLSLALMEAMAAGLPAVVSDVGDLGDLVRDGGNGYLVRNQTPEAFAESIATLLDSPDLRECMGREARSAMAGYDMKSVAERWNEILDQWRNGALTGVRERAGAA